MAATPPAAEGFQTSLGGHETFPFRSGWLKKGIDVCASDPDVFSRDDGIVSLGVGKNMVRSIRYWLLVMRLAAERPAVGNSRSKPTCPTDLGTALFSDSGWDPYLENPASIWLLHWLIVSNRGRATVWRMAFTQFPEPIFTKAGLGKFLGEELLKLGHRATKETLDRDIDCLVRGYVASRSRESKLTEETFDCPLADLRVVRADSIPGTYRFDSGPKQGLPSSVVAFAVLECVALAPSNTIDLSELLYGFGSPGAAFKLDRSTMIEYLEELEALTDGACVFQENAGLRQVYVHRPVRPSDLLANYYSGRPS